MLSKYLFILFVANAFFNRFCNCDTESVEKVTLKDNMTTCNEVEEVTFKIPDEKWIADAIREVAYYLRNYRFNEWDRRYYNEKPNDTESIGFYSNFPMPTLRSMHLKVYENCQVNFYKCLTYLYSEIEAAPMTRSDDTSVMINEKIIPMKKKLIMKIDNECKKSLANDENSGLPFNSPFEKFQWRTSASYYMCWYTMLEIQPLSALGEFCNNHANCLDPYFKNMNNDPRADDRMPFSCAMYSFCPDICCPIIYINNSKECYYSEKNPCFLENKAGTLTEKICILQRSSNRNFKDIVLNRFNISCYCKEKGFIWKPKFGMCVDINECTTGEHNCDLITQQCINLPGSFKCICRRDYGLDDLRKKCIKKNIFFKKSLSDFPKRYSVLIDYILKMFWS